MKAKRLICLFLAFSISLSLCGCGASVIESDIASTEVSVPVVTVAATKAGPEPVPVAAASEMKLVKTVGGVHVMDDSGIEQPLIPNMNLYSGYGAGTGDSSYAWINLDDTKLLKMDEQSRASFQKDGRKLKVTLSEGKIFFCVLESLEEDETLEFTTPNLTNMVMAVRGTTGFVEVISDHETKITLLEGKIEGTSVPGSFTMSTGKLTDIIVPCNTGKHDIGEEDSGIETRDIDYDKDVPWFVIDEIQNNPNIKDKIEDNGGFTDYPESGTDKPVDETTHEYSYRKEFVAPTCIDEGYTLHTCICGYSRKTAYVGPLGHQWDQWKTVKAPTTLSEGLAERACSRCEELENKVLPRRAPSHIHSYTEEVMGATCTDEGYTRYTCTCGDIYQDNHVSPLGHQWSEWVTTKEPTETAEGAAERTCGQCGGKEGRTLPVLIPGHTHTYVDRVTKEPTCTTMGITTYTCTCGDMYTESIKKAEHTWNQTDVKNCTCTEDGYIEMTCQICGQVTHNPMRATGHEMGSWKTVQPPTVTTAGIAIRSCSLCTYGEMRTLPIVKPDHTHEYSSAVTVEPTCTSMGEMTFTCPCGDVYTESINQSAHAYDADAGERLEPTCTLDGYAQGVCMFCGNALSRTTLPALGHAWDVWITVQEPTGSTEGSAERSCSRCGVMETCVLPKLVSDHAHSYTSEITQEPACTTEGTALYTCTCGDSFKSAVTPLGHQWSEWHTDWEPTETTPGSASRVCYRCLFSETRVLNSLPLPRQQPKSPPQPLLRSLSPKYLPMEQSQDCSIIFFLFSKVADSATNPPAFYGLIRSSKETTQDKSGGTKNDWSMD